MLPSPAAALRQHIYVKDRGILAHEQRRAFQALGVEPTDRPTSTPAVGCARTTTFRTFGAVMSTGKSEAEEKPEESARGAKSVKKAQKL